MDFVICEASSGSAGTVSVPGPANVECARHD
jgi:hypothetical protein